MAVVEHFLRALAGLDWFEETEVLGRLSLIFRGRWMVMVVV
jgi:hypothetical protein